MGNISRQKRGSEEQPGSKVTSKKEQKVCVLEEASEDREEGIKSELRYGADKYRAERRETTCAYRGTQSRRAFRKFGK